MMATSSTQSPKGAPIDSRLAAAAAKFREIQAEEAAEAAARTAAENQRRKRIAEKAAAESELADAQAHARARKIAEELEQSQKNLPKIRQRLEAAVADLEPRLDEYLAAVHARRALMVRAAPLRALEPLQSMHMPSTPNTTPRVLKRLLDKILAGIH